jgi:O-antigen ligase
MAIWLLDLLFIGLGWLRLTDTLKPSSLILPGLTLAGVLTAGALTTGCYDRPIALLALLGALSVMRGCPLLAQVWIRLQPWLALAIAVGVAMLDGQRPYYINIYAAWLALLYPYGARAIVLTGLCLTRSLSAIAGLVIAWLAQSPRWLLVIPAVLIAVAMVRPWSLGARITIWSEAMRLFMERPIFGWGTGSYYRSLFGPIPGMIRTTTDWHIGHAHNALLNVAAENGLIGVAAMAWLLYRAGRLLARSDSPAKIGILALAFQQLLDETWLNPLSAILLGLQLGLLETEC